MLRWHFAKATWYNSFQAHYTKKVIKITKLNEKASIDNFIDELKLSWSSSSETKFFK